MSRAVGNLICANPIAGVLDVLATHGMPRTRDVMFGLLFQLDSAVTMPAKSDGGMPAFRAASVTRPMYASSPCVCRRLRRIEKMSQVAMPRSPAIAILRFVSGVIPRKAAIAREAADDAGAGSGATGGGVSEDRTIFST